MNDLGQGVSYTLKLKRDAVSLAREYSRGGYSTAQKMYDELFNVHQQDSKEVLKNSGTVDETGAFLPDEEILLFK